MLELNPSLQAKTLFFDLQRRFPGWFPDIQLHTLQRKIKAWRATEGPPKEVFFDQIHRPGQLVTSELEDRHGLLFREFREPQPRASKHPLGTWRGCCDAPHRSADGYGEQPWRS
jgi:hypothetical protein